ncbi:MAG: Maf family protein [Xanthobacteraceae bacterium]
MPLWLADMPLVLASRSGIRRAILTDAGIPVEVVPADIDERDIEARAGVADAREVAALLAQEKAAAVSARMPGRLVLGADQTLALGWRRFSKPMDAVSARVQLLALSGNTHELHAALALVCDGAALFAHREAARLTMRTLSEDYLDAYLDAVGTAATESVGGYQLEKTGIQLFEQIEGDHFTILGLPILPLLKFLRQEGSLAQ